MLKRAVLLVAVTMGAMVTCKADTIGPLMLGNESPLRSDGTSMPVSLGNGTFVAPLLGSGVNVNGVGRDMYLDYIVSFTYDLLPGWSIDNMFLSNYVDYGSPDQGNDWGFEFSEKVILCPAAGSCSSASTSSKAGPMALPPVYLGATTSAGSGVYEIAGWADDTQFATNGGMQAMDVFLNPVPEPGSIFLLGVGVAGLPVLQYFRRRKG
jgi:hypothetical protein